MKFLTLLIAIAFSISTFAQDIDSNDPNAQAKKYIADQKIK